MKKKAALLGGLLCVLLLTAYGGRGTLEGRYLRAAGGVSLIITEGSGPIVLSDRSEGGGLFDGLNSGDLIEVTCDSGIVESYPGQAGAYSFKFLQGSALNSIPAGTLAELAELGYTPVGGSTADGWYLATVEGSEEGGPLLVGEGWPKGECLVDMVGGLFDGLESGDRIRVTYDMPAGSPWPGVNWVFTCELLEKGALSDIPENALTTMEEAGYDFGRHVHQPAAEPQTVDAPISGYCGNTVTKVTVDGETYSFWGSDSVTLTDLLENLAYGPEVCRCMTEFTVDTEFGGGYGVNLTESFVRSSERQASLTTEQVEAIRAVLVRSCGGMAVTQHDWGSGETRAFLLTGSDAASLTELLSSLDYKDGTCDCMPEYTVDTAAGPGYGVSLTENYARLEDRQAELVEKQAALLKELFSRNGGI